MTKQNSEQFVVQGFTCANCAARFEKNVKNISTVDDATVNFSIGKIKVDGEVTIEQLEEAGAFENLKVRKESESAEPQQPFWKKRENILVYFASILVITGWSLVFSYGEGHLLTIGVFLIAIVIGGYRLFLQGLKNLFQLQFDMKTLMTIAIIGAAIIGEWGEGALVVILFAISEALERYSMESARRSIRSLVDVTPKEATVVRDGLESTIPVKEIKVGDHIIVKPGEKLAVDGVVTKGTSAINEASITGESIPQTKQAGDNVYAATLNEEGVLEVKATKEVNDTTIAKIIHLVEEAQNNKAPAQQFIDRFATYYTPAIMLLALLVAVVPPLLFSASWEQWIYLGLATLVVGCPCALVISTPVAIVTAISNSAKKGILIKGGIYLEKARAIDVIAFDKTGTLTRGFPEVTNIVGLSVEEKDVLAHAYALEKHSQHPLAKAIVRKAEAHLKSEDYQEMVIEDTNSLTGKGVSAIVNGRMMYVSSPAYVNENYPTLITNAHVNEITKLQNEGKTVVVVGSEEKVFGLIGLRDEVRPNVKKIVAKLGKAGVKHIVMLTGDNKATASAIAREAGVTEVHAELLPEEKLQHIKNWIENGYRVAMVGDGMNDAPALALADVGVAMGTIGTDTALETADIALMGDDLEKLTDLKLLSKKTMQIIKQNIVFSLGLKAVALLLVPFGWLTLWIAIFADMGATLLVTFNSLRLYRIKMKE
ncbi:heavy metal translocating P-type ATPase [Evansella cellulosilytica]|uniref:Cd(2+)-exporting ATPase n=1 Tax=Evansella cellulosilytica (strain ATCC 21833 / DSM 2522 / FERM P-1141 / JCM 9156 / N-4) TaxID=649639 RepID=E6TV21_EVAC2|nr:heavy metal translocating P-type ATPase [Evansella cellulosilytica]ADU28604.1 heavy metal translocating P-type ATPase [Evansella cellulosilytica DSM 2522]